jgi:hypothetical protein
MAKDARRHKYSGKQIYTDTQKKDGFASVLARKERALKNSDGRKTNGSFAATDTEFKEACARAKVEPTARQASKWFRKTGMAYRVGRVTQPVEA